MLPGARSLSHLSPLGEYPSPMNSPRPFIRWNITLTFTYACVFLASAAYMHIAAATSAANGFYAFVATLPWSYLLAVTVALFSPNALGSESLWLAFVYISGLLNILLIYTVATFLQKRLRRARPRTDGV